MKWPGVCCRWKTPYHFMRTMSSSGISPMGVDSAACRRISGSTSRPSFAVFSASILFATRNSSLRSGYVRNEKAQVIGE